MSPESANIDPCCSSSSNMLSVEEAIEYLLSRADIKLESESVGLKQALGRVLAKDQSSPVFVPPADNSAMDGYAVNTKDFASGGDKRLPVTQRIPAGTRGKMLVPGTAARIFTGAPVPDGADAIVMQELTEKDGDCVIVKATPRKGDHIRKSGEDICAGDRILSAGQKLRPQELGLAASVGIGELPVYRKLKIAIFSTGDELVTPGNPLGEGQIYNSNLYTLTGMVQALNCDIIDLGTVPDNLDSTKKVLQEAQASADIIVTSGGVSVGEEDYVKAAIEE
ncbi:MAG: molybdopterin molybdotransferase MoeA, partial [Gammaproteobacteria bacterium]|nr:molybdopterin molybdotransferase MoeA [Gammaproteobacteria bacterium]